jgi:hypothetical protein
MLEPKHIAARAGVARRLLSKSVRIVSNSALYGLVIWCIGCVIPTPLDRAPGQTNYRPTFVTSQVTPGFGKQAAPVGGAINLSIAATDPNEDDTLIVHFFQPDLSTPGAFVPAAAAPLTLMTKVPPDADDPNLRIGSEDAPLCLNVPANTTFDIYAVVADRAFNTMGNLTHADAGLTDTNHWTFTCTSSM